MSREPGRSVALIGLIAAGRSGVSRYARALTLALDRVQPEFPHLRLRLVTTRIAAATPLEHLEVAELPLETDLVRAGPVRVLLEQVRAATVRADLVHFFDLAGPVLAPRRAFTATAHDAAVVHGFNRVVYAYKRKLHPWAAARARALVAVSHFAADEAVRHLGARRDRIAVVHSGPGLSVDRPATPVGPREERHLLYVGNLTASKNLPFLVRAFDRASAPLPLVLVGRPGEGSGELRKAIAAARHGDRVRVVTDASDEVLEELYRTAAALLLPSRYEGFAFTPLEAMARGCPVVASDIPAVREISGAGSLLVPVDDEHAWADALQRLAADPGLRDELRSRGEEVVSRYSWEATARSLCEVFARTDPGR